ncbi:hypothetical protein [Terrabacter sp. 2RAF25]|uniref:hypothetical protein n=1 Tax=Terrabacter sp. 2RAF25 TaxID=3232998 RepID=UPI003F970D60
MSATDDELGPDTPEQRSAPEAGELQLRKALSTMNDLEPPRDDLFAQRAIIRGRARTSRRRSTVFGAAAALLVVAGAGTAWVAGHSASQTTASAGSAAEAPKAVSGAGGSGRSPQSLRGTDSAGGPEVAPARDPSTWFGTVTSRQTAAFESVVETLVTRWPDTFSGAYAADAAGSRVVVTVTGHDPTLEALVRGAMPAAGDVEFVVVKHSYAEKSRVLQEIGNERETWRAKGVQILGLSMDARTDTVTVLTDGGGAPGQLARRYGDLVRVVPSTPVPAGKLPDGSTLPTLQR